MVSDPISLIFCAGTCGVVVAAEGAAQATSKRLSPARRKKRPKPRQMRGGPPVRGARSEAAGGQSGVMRELYQRVCGGVYCKMKSGMPTKISVQHLDFFYGSKRALSGIAMDIAAQQI